MRRFFPLVLVMALLLPAAAWAASAPVLVGRPGDGTLVVDNGSGSVIVRARGGILGRFDTGNVVISDLDLTRRRGCRSSTGPRRIRVLGNGRTHVLGEDVRFRMIGGLYRVQINAIGHRRQRGRARGRRPRRVGLHRLPGPLPDQRRAVPAAPRPLDRLHARSGARSAGEVTSRPNQSVLVVEDESSIASFVALYLKNAGYGVRTAATGNEALAQFQASVPALIVLDLMLPDIDGIEVCRRIRKSSDVPILMLTARDEDVDKIIGLEVGADDYLTKPFNPRELVARVKSILRRASPERRQIESKQLRHGELLIDAGRREVRVGDEEIQLAPKEFDLLWELLDHRGLVLTRDQLLERVWGYTFAGDTRTVDVHVRQLRRKLGDASPIVTVWGVGYKVAPAKDAAA